MIKLKGDVRLALVVIAVAVVYLVMDLRLPPVRLGDPLGPKAFPAVVGIGLAVSAVLLLFEVRKKNRAEVQADTESKADSGAKRRPLVLLAMVGWTVLYYACFVPAGYLVATSVFLLGLLSYFNRGRHKTNVAVAVGFTLVFDLLFTYLLGIPMPPGFLSI